MMKRRPTFAMSEEEAIAELSTELVVSSCKLEGLENRVTRSSLNRGIQSKNDISGGVAFDNTKLVETFKENLMETFNATLKQSIKKVIEQDKVDEDDRKEKAYPDDTYSFIALGPFQDAATVNGNSEKTFSSCLPFLLGFVVFAFQVSLLLLMLFSKAWKPLSQVLEVDNPEADNSTSNVSPASFISANSSQLVRMTQFLSILAFFLFGGESVSDLVQAVLHAPAMLYSQNYFKKEFWLQLSSLLCFIQGFLGCMTAMLLVVSSNDVIDIVLNFTAVHFISNFDNMAFELAANGFYGETLLKATETVGQMELPKKTVLAAINNGIASVGTCASVFREAIRSRGTNRSHRGTTSEKEGVDRYPEDGKTVKTYGTGSSRDVKRDRGQGIGKGGPYLLVVGILAITWCTILSIIFWYGDHQKWATRVFRVQFFNNDSDLKLYSGCYEYNENGETEDARQHDRRLQFVSIGDSLSPRERGERESGARLAYCKKDRKWILHKNMKENNPCNVEEKDKLAASEKTLAFDVQTAFDGAWKTIQDRDVEVTFGTNITDVESCKPEENGARLPRTGDGICDETLNTFQYNFDGGDCCQMDCDFRIPGDCADKNLTQLFDLLSQKTGENAEEHPCKEPVFTIVSQRLKGTIPSNIAGLTQTTSLNLAYNELTGGVPPEIEEMTQLSSIHLEHNGLGGSIPSGLGSLEALTTLSLNQNEFTGTIPSELGDLTELKYLYLDDNKLTGSIPNEIGALIHLTNLHLYGNKLTGLIPPSIGNLTDVEWLEFSRNTLVGTVPSEIGKLEKLTELRLAENLLYGTIPTELEHLKRLRILNVARNWLDGGIPTYIGKLKQLTELELHDNNFDSIPAELGNLSHLRILNIKNNTLYGTLPTQIGSLTELRTLSLHENEFTGTLPSEVGMLTYLRRLEIHGNNFTAIPSEVGKLTNLEYFEFHDNNFNEIPCEVITLIYQNNLDPNMMLERDFTVASCAPSSAPSSAPSDSSSPSASSLPSTSSLSLVSSSPTSLPTSFPSSEPTSMPSVEPTSVPSIEPSSSPSVEPTSSPTSRPVERTSSLLSSLKSPSEEPSSLSSEDLTSLPSDKPTFTTTSLSPTSLSSTEPSSAPSDKPTSLPSMLPSSVPSGKPTSPPTSLPSKKPTSAPSLDPTSLPSVGPSSAPSEKPTPLPSVGPTFTPSVDPTSLPSFEPTSSPSADPTSSPSVQPTSSPSEKPTSLPSMEPSSTPSEKPTSLPSIEPSSPPSTSSAPSVMPSEEVETAGVLSCVVSRPAVPATEDMEALVTSYLNTGTSIYGTPMGCWKTSAVTNMEYTFRGQSTFTGQGEYIELWDTGSVTSMRSMFYQAKAFNQPLNNWNVNSVSNMLSMFDEANAFNQPLDNWSVNSVTSMRSMFREAFAFNQPLDNWSVNSVTTMEFMFSDATAFNNALNSWSLNNVSLRQYGMFSGARAFNQPLNDWNVNAGTTFSYMFEGASNFNQPLDNWNVDSIRFMTRMFAGASDFNQALSSWNVNSVRSMKEMFENASSFNRPLNTWSVNSVTTMFEMFRGASNFNQCLGGWGTHMGSRTISTTNMFLYSGCPYITEPKKYDTSSGIPVQSSSGSYTSPFTFWCEGISSACISF